MAMEISFSEKLSDMYEKASQASRVVGGLLPGTSLYLPSPSPPH